MRSGDLESFGRAAAVTFAVVALVAAKPREARADDLPRVAVAARFGVRLIGGASIQQKCSGDCSQTWFHPTNDSVSETFEPVLDLELLVRLVGGFRFGTSLGVLPTVSGRWGTTSSAKLGTEVSPGFLAEYAIPVASVIWIVPRVAGGPELLFPGHDLSSNLGSHQANCQQDISSDQVSSSGCGDMSSMKVGWAAGGGAGVMFATPTRLRPRVDLFLQHYDFGLYNVKESGGVNRTASDTFSGNRFWLIAGLEF